MPQTKREKLVYTMITCFFTVIGFVFYCMSYENGGILNVDLGFALKMIPVEFVLAVLSAEFIGNPLASKAVMKVLDPKKNDEMIMIGATVCATAFIMCSWMSFLAQWLYGLVIPGMMGAPVDLGMFLATLIPCWLQTVVLNFPFALLGQLFVFQPLSRTIFRKIFRR